MNFWRHLVLASWNFWVIHKASCTHSLHSASHLFGAVCIVGRRLRQKKKRCEVVENDEPHVAADNMRCTWFCFRGSRVSDNPADTMPDPYLMMLEVSSACESLHRGLARIRHASADSTCVSRWNRSHLVNHTKNALTFLLGILNGFIAEWPTRTGMLWEAAFTLILSPVRIAADGPEHRSLR